jgi:hypothetical protein
MKTIIAGSRFEEKPKIIEARYAELLDAVTDFELFGTVTQVVSGTARGVDRLGERWAREHGIRVTRFQPDWLNHGKSAGFRRNQEMADYADALIALWDGQSRGTAKT